MFFVVAIQPGQSAGLIPLERTCNMGGETALLVFLLLHFRKTEGIRAHLFSPMSLAIAAAATTAISIEGSAHLLLGIAAPVASHVICGFVSGCGQGVLFAQAFHLLLRAGGTERANMLALGVSLAGVVACLLCSVPQEVAVPLIAICPGTCAVCLIQANRLSECAEDNEERIFSKSEAVDSPLSGGIAIEADSERTQASLRHHLITIVCSLVIFGVLFGVGSIVALSSGVDEQLSFLLFLPFFLQGIALLLLRLPEKCRRNFSAVSSWLMVAAVITLVLIPLANPLIRVVALATLILVCQLSFLAALIQLLHVCSQTRASLPCLLAGLASDTFGKALGWALGVVVSLPGELNESVLIYIIIVLVSVLIIWKTHVQNREISDARIAQEDLRERSEQVRNRRAPWQERMHQIGESYGLTAREIEVLRELAKGKTAKFIGEALFISEGTVKSHTYRIYQKFGVHSQQELMMLLEKAE